MEVDLDSERMREFRRVGTAGQDVLTSESQFLPSFRLNAPGCTFFLDTTNWDPNVSVPSASFVEDVTLGEEESPPPDAQFIKPWQMEDSRAEAWPPRASVWRWWPLGVRSVTFETMCHPQPHHKGERNFNPFASPQNNNKSGEKNLKDAGDSGWRPSAKTLGLLHRPNPARW
ncbi:hypothetical protein FD755_012376, partial [Muntiacus reevesi]